MKRAAIYNLTWNSLGGGERYAAAFAKVLEKSRMYDIEIWSDTDYREQIRDRFAIDLERSKFIPSPIANVSFVSRLMTLSKYDLIFWVSDGSLPLSFAKKTIVHFQIPFHGPESGSLANKIKSKLYISVSNSKFTKKVIDVTYGISSQVIYPPVDTQAFTAGKKSNTILALGRLSKILHAKRQDTLIEAFAKLHKLLPDWKLVLAGGSQDEEYYQYLVKKAKGLPIEIITNPTLKQVRELLSQAKIFWSATGYGIDTNLQPEKAEHFGITPVEAMAAGTVPIVTAAGGHLETVVTGQSGVLWSTIDELVDGTHKLAMDETLLKTLSSQAIARSKDFSVELFERNYATLI